MKTMEADVIVVAAGPAGLAAAITAGENDLKAIVFEKSNTTGGAANMGMGPLGIGTKIPEKSILRYHSRRSAEQTYGVYTLPCRQRSGSDILQ